MSLPQELVGGYMFVTVGLAFLKFSETTHRLRITELYSQRTHAPLNESEDI